VSFWQLHYPLGSGKEGHLVKLIMEEGDNYEMAFNGL